MNIEALPQPKAPLLNCGGAFFIPKNKTGKECHYEISNEIQVEAALRVFGTAAVAVRGTHHDFRRTCVEYPRRNARQRLSGCAGLYGL